MKKNIMIPVSIVIAILLVIGFFTIILFRSNAKYINYKEMNHYYESSKLYISSPILDTDNKNNIINNYKFSDIELTSSIKTHVSQDYKEGVIIDNIKKEINVILSIIKDIIQKLNMNTGYEIITALSNISYNLKKILLEI